MGNMNEAISASTLQQLLHEQKRTNELLETLLRAQGVEPTPATRLSLTGKVKPIRGRGE